MLSVRPHCVAFFFHRRVQGLHVELFPLVEILTLVLADPTHDVQRLAFDLPYRLDRAFIAKPTIRQHALRPQSVLDDALDDRDRLRDLIHGALLSSSVTRRPRHRGFLVLLLARFAAPPLFRMNAKIQREAADSITKARTRSLTPHIVFLTTWSTMYTRFRCADRRARRPKH